MERKARKCRAKRPMLKTCTKETVDTREGIESRKNMFLETETSFNKRRNLCSSSIVSCMGAGERVESERSERHNKRRQFDWQGGLGPYYD
jgi:hypothetical protein